MYGEAIYIEKLVKVIFLRKRTIQGEKKRLVITAKSNSAVLWEEGIMYHVF